MLRRIFTYRKHLPLLIRKISNYLSWFSDDMANLVLRMNRVFDKHDVKMTYFISTYLLESRPSFISNFESHDYGPHGHLHPDYTLIGKEAAFKDMEDSVLIFKKLKLDPWVFRAPYGLTKIENDDAVFFEFEKSLGVMRDSSINIKNPPWNKPPHPIKHENGVITIPLLGVSDDWLIDGLALNDKNEILRHLVKALDLGKTGVLVYDLHPIRMGQSRYIEILDAFIKIINHRKNHVIMSLKEAFLKFDNKDKEETIVCLTGDIDNLSLLDYFRRLKRF